MALSTNTTYRVFLEKLGGTDPSVFVGNEGELFYDPNATVLKISDGSTAGGVAAGGAPVAKGFITLNGTSPTWTGTSGYVVSGAQPGGPGTDYEIVLTFPTPYSARTDYIVQATYDGTDYVAQNGAEIGVARRTADILFTPRRWDEQPLSLGDIMITIHNL